MNLKRTILFIFVSVSLLGNDMFAQKPVAERTFNDNFKEQYSGDKFNYEGTSIVSESPMSSGSNSEFKEGDPNIKEENSQNEGVNLNLGPLTWVFYIALFLGVVYLLYILFNEGGSGLFSSRQNTKLNTHQQITADNLENTDLDTLIKNAEGDNDYRLAIRYYYLKVLKTLSLKNIIQFEDDKTNAEYVTELETKPYSNGFKDTSYLYNYVWYGEFPLNSELYDKAKLKFNALLNQVK